MESDYKYFNKYDLDGLLKGLTINIFLIKYMTPKISSMI